jgi:hypothetical protein
MDFLPDGTFYLEDPAALKIPETSEGSGATATLQGPGSGRRLPTLDTSSGFIDDGTLRVADPDALAVPDPNTWRAADPITPVKPISGSGSNWEWDWETGLVRETWMSTIQQDQHAWEKVGRSWDWLAGCCGKCKASTNCGSQEFHSQPNHSSVNGGKGRLLASQDHMGYHDIATSVFAGLIASSSVVGKGLDPSIDPPATTTTATPPGGIPKRHDPDPPIVPIPKKERRCGHDITDRFATHLALFFIDHKGQMLDPFGLLDKLSESRRVRPDPDDTGDPTIWFNYKFQRLDKVLQVGDEKCPYGQGCADTIELCGFCLPDDIPGNIALGAITGARILKHAISEIDSLVSFGRPDSESDRLAIQFGNGLRKTIAYMYFVYRSRPVTEKDRNKMRSWLCKGLAEYMKRGAFEDKSKHCASCLEGDGK